MRPEQSSCVFLSFKQDFYSKNHFSLKITDNYIYSIMIFRDKYVIGEFVLGKIMYLYIQFFSKFVKYGRMRDYDDTWIHRQNRYLSSE